MSITAAGWPWPAARFTTRPLGQQVQLRRSPRSYSSHERQHLADAVAGQLAQRVEVDLDVEVAGVRQHGAVLHPLEVLARAARRA